MYILDTNVVSHILRYGYQTELGQKVTSVSPPDVWVSIVTVNEILHGRIAAISREQKPDKITLFYSYFQQTFEALKQFQILPFDDNAQRVFQSISTKIRQRAGTQDCRIAAIAISKNFTIVTMNVSDFHLIPNLKFEDWSKQIS